mgnify:CR=1 FL=1
MLGLNELRQTRVFQEALEEGRQEGLQQGLQEGKLQSIPRTIEFGLSQDAIAQILDLPPELVQQAATAFHQQNLAAFIQLVDGERSLFSPPDFLELEQLISPLPNDLEALSLALLNWYKQPEKSQIFARLVEVRKTLTNNTSESGFETETTTVEMLENQLNKQTLLNAIANFS